MEEHSYQEGSNKKKERALFLQAFFVFTFFLSLFFLTNSGADTSEGWYDYLEAERFVRVGDTGFVEKPSYAFTLAPNGKYYAIHEIGNALFMIPLASLNEGLSHLLAGRLSQPNLELLRKFIFSFLASVYLALTLAIYYVMLRRHFVQNGRISFLATLLLGCATYLWTYIRQVWDGVLVTLLIVAALFFLFEFRNSRSSRFYIYSLILLGLAFITRVPTILITFAIVGLAIMFVATGSEQISFRMIRAARLLLLAFVILFPFGVWQLYYNWLRSGSPFVSPVAFSVDAGLAIIILSLGDFVQGIMGQLFSPSKSIFIYAPLLVLSLLSFMRFLRRYRLEALFVLTVTVTWLSFHALIAYTYALYGVEIFPVWTGDWGWGPRYLLIILPIMFLPFATNLRTLIAQRIGQVAVIMLSTLGLALSIASIITNWQFRMFYLTNVLGLRLKDLYWSPDNNLVIDTLAAALANTARTITNGPIPQIQPYSDLNLYMSNTLNVWPAGLLHFGVSPIVVGTLVAVLFAGLIFSLRMLFSSIQKENRQDSKGVA